MNILITSGGTCEPIDEVRHITNLSGGRLGAKIADEALKRNSMNKVFFVYSKRSELPASYAESNKLVCKTYTTVNGLQTIMRNILTYENIDVVIHAAAVSDYKVAGAFDAGGNELAAKGKISSDNEEIILKLVKTPKLINEIKKIAPQTRLVGFKFLVDAPIEDLFNAAKKTMNNNDCEFVLANRLIDLNSVQHIGYLLNKNGEILEKFMTKNTIFCR